MGEYALTPGAEEKDYKNYYRAYYDNYGEIKMCQQNKTVKGYDMEDSFFTKTTVRDLEWEKDSYAVPVNCYIYMAFEVKKDTVIDSVSLFARSAKEETQTLNIYLYVLSDISFDSVCAYDDPFYEVDGDGKTKVDGNNNPIKVAYDYPDASEKKAEASIRVNESRFSSFTIELFGENNEETVTVKEGDYILLGFYNNCMYGKQAGLSQVEFNCLNLMIRAV